MEVSKLKFEGCIQSSLDYTSVPPVESAVEGNFDSEIFPTGVQLPINFGRDEVVLKFDLPKVENLYMDFLQSSLRTTTRIIKSHGTICTKQHLVAPVVAPAASMIHTAEIWGNGRLIKAYYNLNYVYHLKSLCHLPRSYLNSVVNGCQQFAMDTSPFDNVEMNEGLASRREVYQQSTLVHSDYRLFLPCFQQVKL